MNIVRNILVTGIMTGAVFCVQAAEPAVVENTVSLPALISRTIENDAAINTLRNRLQIANIARGSAAPLNNPEVRLGYSDVSDTTDLGPVVDPMAAPSEDYDDSADQYSAQVRLYPRNPFVVSAQKEHAAREQRLAAAELAAAEHIRALDVTEKYITMLRAYRIFQLNEQEEALRREEDALQKALFEAGRLSAEQYNEGRIRSLEIQMDLGDAEQDYLAASQALAMDARLVPNEKIDHTMPPCLQETYAERLTLDELRETMKQYNRVLHNMDAQYGLAQSEVSIAKAEQVPWINLLSATYQREERYDVKYRDEYTFVAGIEIPIFDWFGNKNAPLAMKAENLSDQYDWAEEDLVRQLEQAVYALQHSEVRLSRFLEREKEITEDVSARLIETESANDLLQHRQFITCKRMLLDLESKSMRMKYDHAMRIIELERLLGVRLQVIMK